MADDLSANDTVRWAFMIMQRISMTKQWWWCLVPALMLGPLVGSVHATSVLNEELLEAAKSGDLVRIEGALRKGANPNFRDDELMSALNWASSKGHENAVSLLLDNGADVNAKHSLAPSPLISAAGNGHIGIVRLLLSRGADVSAVEGESGATALVAAADSGHLDVVQLILPLSTSRGNKETALRVAAARGHLEVVRMLLAKGVDINSSNTYGDRVTPLMFAVRKGHLDVVRELLANGADVNAKSRSGDTALAIAQTNKDRSIEQILSEHGAK